MKASFNFMKYTCLFLMLIGISVNAWGAYTKAEGTFVKVTNAASLAAGDEIIIVASEYNYALSTTQNTNNRGESNVDKNDNKITLTAENNVQLITLSVKNNHFEFNTGEGYLYAASSSNNCLKTQATNNANGEWTISISEGVAAIIAQGTNTRNVLQYNSSSSLFSCYASASQKGVSIYRKRTASPTTIILSEAGVESIVPGTYYANDIYTLPTTTASTCGDKVLVGWSTVEISTPGPKPESNYYEKGAEVTLTATNTFYAVFADEEGSPIVWTKVTEDALSTGGIYAILASNDKAFTGEITSGHGSVTSTAFSFTDGRASEAPAGTIELTFISYDDTEGGYVYDIYNSEKGYLYATKAASGGLAWSLSELSDDDFWVYDTDDACFEFYHNPDEGYYYAHLRNYTGGSPSTTSIRTYSNNSNDAIAFARKTGGTTYSNYTTTCEGGVTYTDYITDCSPVYPIRYACATTGDVSEYAREGVTIQIIDDPEEKGYEFRGWTVTTDGGDPVTVNGTSNPYSFIMPADGVCICPTMVAVYTATWSSASGDPQVVSYPADQAVVPATPTECSTKTFMGWSTAPITELQQSAPATMIDFTTQVYLSGNTTYYAVYASKNGGKVTGSETVKLNKSFVSNLPTETFNGISGMSVSGTSGTVGWSYFDVKAADNYVQTKSKIQDLSKIEIKWRSYNAVAENVTIKISSDGSNWTTLSTVESITTSSDVVTSVSPTLVDDYYVRIDVPQRTDIGGACRLNFNYIKFWSKERTVWYSDYSTTCDMAASATMTFTNGGDQTTHAAGSVPENYTLPTPVWSGHEFVKWTIAGTDYNADDNYVLAHDVTATGVWNEVAGEWTITGDVHLTSYNGVSVYTTNNPNNLVTISGSNLCVGHALRIEYYDGETKITTKSQSLFRVCDASTYSIAEGNRSITSDTYEETVAISYTPSAYGTTNTYKIRIQEINAAGTQTYGDPKDLIVYGRSLPETFVVAAQYNGQWYALPADLTASGASSTKAPSLITVDNTTTPTAATYAPSSALYKGAARDVIGSNRGGIRLLGNTTEKYATANNSDGTLLYMPAGNISNFQDWYLTSSNFSTYTIQINPALGGNARSMCMNGGTIGYYKTGTTTMYLLPVTNVLTDREAEIVEWGQHSAILEVDAVNPTAINKVVARIGATSSDAITLTQTTTSGKASATKYNYTAAFGNTIDFAANEGNVLYLDWKNGDATVGTTAIEIPRIIATNKSMSSISTTKSDWSNANVIVLPGVTLTADVNNFDGSTVTIKNLEVYPGATLNISAGTLTTTNLTLRVGWTRATQKSYDVARVYINDAASLKHSHAYMDCYIDYDQYYPIAVPFPVTASAITYRNTNSLVTYTGEKPSVVIRTYNGAQRASTVQANTLNGDNWTSVTPATLTPSTGYAITARRPTGKAFSILRMPLTFTDAWTTSGEKAQVDAVTKNTVTVGKYTSTAVYASGWNFVANPYMAVFNGDGDNIENCITNGSIIYEKPEVVASVRYATIPTEDFRDYYQEPIATAALKPASAFFIQATEDGSIAFSASKRQAAPAAVKSAPQEIEAFIRLTSATERDQMGLLIGQQFTADYDFNADLTKIMGEAGTLKTYLTYGGYDLAYVAVPELLAREMIPVVVNLPQEGEYTFSVRETASLSALEGLYLMDYQEGVVTNLLNDDYTFTAQSGTVTNRFALNAVVQSHEMPTGDNGQTIDSNGPNVQKIIYKEHFYIIVDGKIYDGKGSLVNGIK